MVEEIKMINTGILCQSLECPQTHTPWTICPYAECMKCRIKPKKKEEKKDE